MNNYLSSAGEIHKLSALSECKIMKLKKTINI